MTKEQMMKFLAHYEDGEVIDEYELADYMQSVAEARQQAIESYEEYQHASGFYAFQDTLDMYRRER